MDPLFPELPEDLTALSDEDLQALLDEHEEALSKVESDDPTYIGDLTADEVLTGLQAGVEQIKQIRELAGCARRGRRGLQRREGTTRLRGPPARGRGVPRKRLRKRARKRTKREGREGRGRGRQGCRCRSWQGRGRVVEKPAAVTRRSGAGHGRRRSRSQPASPSIGALRPRATSAVPLKRMPTHQS